MSRVKVEQVRCDRCKRVELVPERSDKKPSDFKATFEGVELVFDDLCSHCKKAVATLWEDLKEWQRQVKQAFLGDQAPPLTAAPDFKPPKPHSQAGGNAANGKER